MEIVEKAVEIENITVTVPRPHCTYTHVTCCRFVIVALPDCEEAVTTIINYNITSRYRLLALNHSIHRIVLSHSFFLFLTPLELFPPFDSLT